MMSPKPAISEDRLVRSSPIRPAPLQVIHILGNSMRIWSVYSLYRYVSTQEESIVAFIFTCLVPAAIIFLVLQKPWKGRALPNSQVVPTVVNGGIMALYYVLWGKGLLTCGPLLALLGEYAGAVLGVLSAALFGRNVNFFKKVAGLAAMLLSYYLLSNGWATRTSFPLNSFVAEDELPTKAVGMKEMVVPLTAGILSALRRVIARRISLKNQLKRRLHAITIASATCFLFPVAMWDTILGSASDSIVKFQFPSWAYVSTILFGIVLVFYIDNLAEERLHIVFSSPRHLMATSCCIILMEILYGFDFSVFGFLLCTAILGFGIYQATSLDRSKRGAPLESQELSNGTFHTGLPVTSLPS
ncbi:zinc transporter isoform X1 [Carex rostrata]